LASVEGLWSALAKSRLLFQLDELVLPPLDANGGNALLEVAPALRRVAKLRMPLVLEREQGMSAERMQDEFAQRLEFGAVFTHRLAMDVFGDELLMITTCDPTPRHVSMRELVGVYETALERIVPSARAVIDAALMEVEGLDESSDADHPTFTDLATSVLSGAIRELCRVAKVERGGLLELSRLLAEHESCCATVRATLDRGW